MRHNFLKWIVVGFVPTVSVFLNTVPPIWAQAKQTAHSLPSSNRWRTYHNVRFGYSLSYPAFLLVPQEEAGNGDGRRFISPNTKTELLVYGSNNVLDETIRSRFADSRHSDTKGASRRIVTYAQQKKNWYVVSGYRNEKIFYQKCYQVEDHFVSLEIEYPKAKRASYDKIVSRIVHDFEPGL